MSKGFGKPKLTKIDKFIEQAVNYTRCRFWLPAPDTPHSATRSTPISLNSYEFFFWRKFFLNCKVLRPNIRMIPLILLGSGTEEEGAELRYFTP